MAKKFGLGVRHDVPMSAVARGLAPNKDWKARTYGQDWLIGDTANAAIGQGYMLASPLQLAVMAARLATGRAVSPRLVKSVNGVEQPSGAGEPLDINMYELGKDLEGYKQLPRNLLDALRLLDNSDVLRERMGNNLIDSYVKMKKSQWDDHSSHLTQWERDHTLDC